VYRCEFRLISVTEFFGEVNGRVTANDILMLHVLKGRETNVRLSCQRNVAVCGFFAILIIY